MWLLQRTSFYTWLVLLAVPVGAWTLSSPSDDRYEKGIQAYQREAYVKSRNHLRAVFQDKPAYIGRKGAVAYWLGRAYAACDQPDSSRWVWQRGVEVLRAVEAFDARLFDAHLWAAMEANAERRAVRTYLDLLRYLGKGADPQSAPVLRRHAAQLRPILSDEEFQRLLVDGNRSDRADEWTFAADAGKWILAWWQWQDPLPATSRNERVREHLQRVAVAHDNFAAPDQVDRLDDRGETYVRFGAPARRTEVPFTDLNFLQEVFRPGVPLDRSSFPDNEIWTYSHIDEAGQYLFVARKGTYTLGTAADLLPELLRGPFASSGRSQNIAYSSQAAIRHIYEHLSMKYNDRGNVYDDVMQWFSFQDSQRSLSNMRDNLGRGTATRTVGYGTGARRVYRTPSMGWPSSAARSSMSGIRQQEQAFAEVRRQRMPTVFTGVDTSVARLPMRIRTSRFLKKNGQTNTILDWGGHALRDTLEAMGLFQLDLTTVQYRRGGSQDTTIKQHHTIADLPTRQDVGAVWSTRLPTTSAARAQVALQWDLYAGADSGSASVHGRHVRRITTLQALSPDPSRLEMSDLRPMVLRKPPAEVAGRLSEAGRPYPFRAVSASASLLLGFEVYHLAFGADDQARYTVEYEVVRRKERTGFFSFLRGDDETRTATASTYTGTGRRADEYILLEWGTDPPESPQPATVTVRVTDETTGQSVERSIEFRLLPPDAHVADSLGEEGRPQ